MTASPRRRVIQLSPNASHVLSTIVSAAGNADMMINRLLRHYLGRSDNLLRAEMGEAFEPYGAILVPNGTTVAAQLKGVAQANATG
jgi:hypothetical protein